MWDGLKLEAETKQDVTLFNRPKENDISSSSLLKRRTSLPVWTQPVSQGDRIFYGYRNVLSNSRC